MAFKIFKASEKIFEKKVKDTAAFNTFKDVNFIENHRFPSFPRQKLLEAVIANLKKG